MLPEGSIFFCAEKKIYVKIKVSIFQANFRIKMAI